MHRQSNHSTDKEAGTTRKSIPPWKSAIDNAQTNEEIIGLLRSFELGAVADRLNYLHRWADDDPEEPSIIMQSLRNMALSLMGKRELPDPQVGITPGGLIQVEWRLQTDGILAMEFLVSGQVRFVGISAPSQRNFEPLRVNGVLPKNDAFAAVQPFIALL